MKSPFIMKLVIAVFLAVVIYDILFLEGKTQWTFQPNQSFSSDHLAFEARFRIADLVLDSYTKTMSGKLAVEIKALERESEIEEVVFGLQKNADDSIDWTPSRKGESNWQDFEDVPDPDLPSVSAVSIKKDIMLDVQELRPAIFYPFDASSLLLYMNACVNIGEGVCLESPSNCQIVDASLALRNSNIVLNKKSTKDGSILYSIKRPFFVRLVTSCFAIIALVFFIHLISLPLEEELLPKSIGYFATLLGFRYLMVPPHVSVFPTAVDYYIFTLFTTLFIVLAFKIVPGNKTS